jgi:two-component system chemotaxis response regulator CheB
VHHRERVIGVILTGALNDGTSGLLAIENSGGMTVVQNPETAEFPYMPKSAVKHVKVDHVVDLEKIPPLLATLTQTVMKKVQRKNGRVAFEAAAAKGLTGHREELDKVGKRSTMICPTCKGALWEIEEKSLLRFRCHIGHNYTAEGLLIDQQSEVELALSHALRALEDRADLAKRLAQRAKLRKQKHTESLYQTEMREAEKHAELVRRTLVSVPVNAQNEPWMEP